MKRLAKLNMGGIPYVNSDFTEILQTEHLKCYGGILDAMNQNSYTGRNSGIILKGCDIVSSNGASYAINFSSSMIYLGGEFYEYKSSTTSNTIINSPTFYLYAMATSSQTRYLRNLSSTSSVIEESYFTYSTAEPGGTRPYIKFSSQGTSRRYKRILKYFTSNYGDVYVSSTTQSFSATGLGFNDMEGFVVLNGEDINVPDFSGKFLRSYTDNYFTPDSLFYSRWSNVSSTIWSFYNGNTDRVIEEFPESKEASVDPYSDDVSFFNFPQNIGIHEMLSEGGENQISMDLGTIPSHKHVTLPTTYSMNHSHGYHTSMNAAPFILKDVNINSYQNFEYGDSYAGAPDVKVTNPEIVGLNSDPLHNYVDPPTDAHSNFMRAAIADGDLQVSIYRQIYSQTFGVSNRTTIGLSPSLFIDADKSTWPNLSKHTHSIAPTTNLGTNPTIPHENRPAYRVMVYYTKKYLFPINSYTYT